MVVSPIFFEVKREFLREYYSVIHSEISQQGESISSQICGYLVYQQCNDNELIYAKFKD